MKQELTDALTDDWLTARELSDRMPSHPDGSAVANCLRQFLIPQGIAETDLERVNPLGGPSKRYRRAQ